MVEVAVGQQDEVGPLESALVGYLRETGPRHTRASAGVDKHADAPGWNGNKVAGRADLARSAEMLNGNLDSAHILA